MTDFWTYANAGVDRKQEDDSVGRITAMLSSTFENQPDKVMASMGHYANLVDVGHGQAVVMCTDGVGSKMLVAEALGKFDTVGIDMVAMNVNDLICLGATPIAMVDYLAVEKHEPAVIEQLMRGICDGANQAGVAVIGGETATLPDMLKGYDLAGTALGIIDKDKVITGEHIKEGDVLIGLKSSGVHSNGLTLARKVLDMNDTAILAELLTPTKIYVKQILHLLNHVPVKGLAHMTGGGLMNLKRLNKEIGFDVKNWPNPHLIFEKIQRGGNIPEDEMYKTFNMGIGFCVVVSESNVEPTLRLLEKDQPMILGKAVNGNHVKFKGTVY
ncbi:MAG: phosphoribosylformylglycinamidine cyclo-ligase [archaeon]